MLRVFSGFTLLILLLFLAMLMPVSAQVLMNYQGRLTGLDGEPVANDYYTITFSLWNDSTGGSQLWTETHSSVYTKDGMFTVVLGSDSTLNESVFENEPLFLQIMIAPDIYISPRTRLTSVPSAACAKKVVGDIETGEGYLSLKSPDSNLAVSISAEGRGYPAYLRMFNPNPSYPEQTLVRLSSETDGGNLEFYPAGDFVPNPSIKMGVEPSPFKPGALQFFDPEGALPFDPYIKMGLDPSPFRGYLEFSDPGSSFTDGPMMKMGVEPTPFHKSYFAMYNPDISTSPRLMEMEINDESGDWESFYKMYLVHPPEYPLEKEILTIGNSFTDGAGMVMFNPQPEPPAKLMEFGVSENTGNSEWESRINMYLAHPPEYPTPKEIFTISSSPSTGASMVMFNPQPEPPAEVFNLSMNLLERAGEVSLELTESEGTLQTKLTPGRVKVGDDVDDNMPRGELMAGSDSVTFFIQGYSGMVPAPAIGMLSSSTEAKMGIGTLDINENLVVGSDLGAYSGTRLVVGGNAGSGTGFVFGESSNYRGWMLWDVDDDLIELGTKEGAGTYGNTLVLKGGTVGIGGQSAGSELHVNGDICYTGSIGTCSDLRYKTDIRQIDHALDKILKLRGVTFDWKRNQYPDYKFSDKEQVGVIAQEVEEVLPQVVSEDDNGYYSVDYTKITPLLIEAIKELKAENTELKKRIQEIESRL